MKKTVFVTMIMLGTALVMQAQQVYDKFLEDGKTWKCEYWNGNPNAEKRVYTWMLDGEIVIDGKKCMKLFNDLNSDRTMKHDYTLYEEQKKVYIVSNSGEMSLLYDFGAKAGDVLNMQNHKMTVINVDTIYNAKRGFIRQFIMCDADGPVVHISGLGGSAPTQNYFTIGMGIEIVSCEVNGEEIYGRNLPVEEKVDLMDVWTKWVYDYAGIESPVVSSAASALLYDLQGRRLSAKPAKGIYIHGGRKYVVK